MPPCSNTKQRVVIEFHGRDRTDPLFQESCLEMVRGFLDELLPRGESRP
ncbi:MAG: hypothetical protein JOZ53_23360 [Planctomycetaceae bacterium]|nr:hypothetical protein [Planctomycetaceae bacterium]